MQWPKDLQDYYKLKYDTMKKNDKKALLLNKIKILNKDIATSKNEIEVKSQRSANEGVVFEMENTGVNREQAFGIVFDKAYRQEVVRIQGLMLRKQIAEVELFILSGKPLNDEVRKGWNDEMIEFYVNRLNEMEKTKNQDGGDLKNTCSFEDEVSNDPSAHADFMTQNNVSNVMDTSMASMVDNGVAASTSNVK